MLNARPLVQNGILENIILGIPRVAKAMEDLPVEQLWSVLGAVEGSYWRAALATVIPRAILATWPCSSVL